MKVHSLAQLPKDAAPDAPVGSLADFRRALNKYCAEHNLAGPRKITFSEKGLKGLKGRKGGKDAR